MKQPIESRPPNGIADYLSLAITTFGVGYLPLAPGTWGSMVGVLVYLATRRTVEFFAGNVSAHNPLFDAYNAATTALLYVLFFLFCFLGLWASGRSCELFGDKDPSRAVVDEVIGQLVTFFFVPFGISWPFILSGFILFRIFDIWKPYPIDELQNLPGGLGICADDFLAGIYAGACLAIIYAIV